MKKRGGVGRDKKLPIMIVLAIALVAAIGTAAPEIGRFVPTHKITEPVYCGACHPEQVRELNETTHLAHFAVASEEQAALYGYEMSGEEAISAACTMCHSYWDNFKWFGVANYTLTHIETGDANHGLGSNDSYQAAYQQVIPWTYGLGNDTYTKNNITYTRLDALWGDLSAISPGPAAFQDLNASTPSGCGSAEKGLCHAAEVSVGLAAANKKAEFPGLSAGVVSGGRSGSAVFFTHEMSYTTAQYSAKPVKLCGACHVFKLPPMNQEGEPLPKAARTLTTKSFHSVNLTVPIDVSYDWAHQNVPCIRCHAHAGISE